MADDRLTSLYEELWRPMVRLAKLLVGSDTAAEDIVQDAFLNKVEQGVVADPRLTEAVGRWSSCMKERGHDYDNPLGPVQEFGTDEAPGRPTERELAVARADVECKEATGLVAIYRFLEAERSRPIVDRHGALLEEYRAIVERALLVAREALAAPAPTTTTTFVSQ